MPDSSMGRAPEFKEWSIVAVRLLQGVVYAEDERAWGLLLASRSTLDSYLARLGLALVVDEAEGYAFVRQLAEDERPSGYEQLPKLVRRSALGYGPTLLAVLLRDELRRFEEEDVHNERCVVESEALFEQWRAFFPPEHDEIRRRREFGAAAKRLEELGFARPLGEGGDSFEVRRILKARLPVSELENLRRALADAAARGSSTNSRSSVDD